MNKKTIFFDIDGTLLGTKNGQHFCIPPSALEAIDALIKRGHRVAICSGRQEAFIHKFFPGLFTSYVAMNGTHVVYDGKTIFDLTFAGEQVAELMEHFDSYGCSYTFVGKEHGWARNLPENYLSELNSLYGFSDFLKIEWMPDEVQANMMDFIFQTEEDFERCRSAFSGSMVLNRHPGQLAADLSFKEQDKSKGIKVFLDYAGIDQKDTIAFGDGYNDITMMGAVGCGVAMGNAVDDVKKAADYVTTDIFDDGIYRALKHFELI
jgi:Cof subfamily protein (haloacid dehalogenase superfamily)